MIKWNSKVNEKDYVRFVVIIGVLVLGYFVYANFIPKNFDNTLKIDVVEISVDCADCFDFSGFNKSLQEKGIKIDDYDVYAYNSSKGKKAIKKYGIKKLPALIVVSKDVGSMDIEGVFDVKDDYAVLKRNVPYVDESGKVRGLVDMIEVDANCENCFPLAPLKNKFEQMGVKMNEYEVVGAGSARGLEMVKKYNLDFAPALLISKNIDEYGWIMSEIKGLLVDKGDYYLFNSAIAPYKDLTNDVVRGNVRITLLEDSSCKDCFDVNKLKESFQAAGVSFISEKVLDISSFEGKAFAKKYNVTAVPTVVLSKEILDYSQIRGALKDAGTFDEKDQSFVFRKLDAIGKFREVKL